MANINDVLAKTYELHGGVKSLLRLLEFNEYDDLSSLDINYKDMEQVIATLHSAWYSKITIRALHKKAAEEAVNVLKCNTPFHGVSQALLRL